MGNQPVKYKTAFRLAVRWLGLWLFVSNIAGLVGGIVSFALEFASSGLVSGIFSWMIYNVLLSGLQCGIGLYLFFGGEWIVNRAIPSNRPYCHECGYQLTGLPAGGQCPECGMAYLRPQAPATGPADGSA